VRYCGIDVSAKPGQQQLCTLHPRRGADGATELVATFYEPGDVGAVARTVLGFGREAVVAVDALEAPVGRGAARFGRLCETYPDAVFCALLGHRPSAKRTPWGLQQRIAALRMRGVVDDDGGLWHRTLDELDACAAAFAAYALAEGGGSWVGDPREGVIVLPVPALADRYERLPPPARSRLA